MLRFELFTVLIAFTALALLVPAAGLAAGPAGKEGPAKTCFDNIDNDGDGLIDIDDPDCAGKGGDGDPAPPDNIRARFSANNNAESVPIDADVTGDGVDCDDSTGLFDYVNPNDAGCPLAPQPEPLVDRPIDRSNLSTEGVWWLEIKRAEANLDAGDRDQDGTTDEILVDRWAVIDFTGAFVPGSGQNYTGSLDPSCPDLDAAYNNPDYETDGGPAVDHKSNETRCPNSDDHVVLSIRTERAVDLFSLLDGDILLEHFRVNVPGPPTQSGSRLWRPLYSFSYGAWEKETVDADNIIIRTKSPHEADLIEDGKGPVSKRIVGTYNLPVEITLKRVPAP